MSFCWSLFNLQIEFKNKLFMWHRDFTLSRISLSRVTFFWKIKPKQRFVGSKVVEKVKCESACWSKINKSFVHQQNPFFLYQVERHHSQKKIIIFRFRWTKQILLEEIITKWNHWKAKRNTKFYSIQTSNYLIEFFREEEN